MEIKFLKTHPDAILPKRNHESPVVGDAGFDLFAVEDTVIMPGNSAVVPVGLTLARITPGYWFRIEARSGLGFKHGIKPHFGVIDNGYRGDLGVKLYNDGPSHVTILKGQGCAQFVIFEMIDCEVAFTEEIEESERGKKGFGSSDS